MNHPAVEEKILVELTMAITSTRSGDQWHWTKEVMDFKEAEKFVYLKALLAEIVRDNKFC